jgi:heme-degrading monooxygenase HmoA
MAVLVTMSAAGMDTSAYDQTAEKLTAVIKKQPGFIGHVACETPDGMSVAEVWATREQFDRWFEENVKPNVPFDIKPEIIDAYNLIQP